VDPARYDITIHQGATFDLPLQYMASGVPVNMTGYSIDAELWNKTGTVKLSDFSVPWVAQVSGMFKLRLASTATSGITEQGQYDVMFTEPSGDKYYALQGTAFIDLGLTGRGL
jgi:hypothetical protein